MEESTELRGEILRLPDGDELRDATLTKYFEWLEREHGVKVGTYQEAWVWSTADVGRFWSSIWEYFDVIASTPATEPLRRSTMPDVSWFPGARLNYAENALRWTGSEAAIFAWDEGGNERAISRDELRDLVARTAAGLSRLGVRAGDRVGGYLPVVPEALITLLATASLGAIWSCCPPDYGARSVLDRFQQIEPKVIITIDEYVYRGRTFDRRGIVDELRAALPDSTFVSLSPTDDGAALSWDDLIAEPADLAFAPMGFEAPLWILFSSGSTGPPKPIMHGHGGVVLEHLKSLGLQVNITEHDRVFQYTSSGWVMWNIHVGALLVGATVMLYNGAADFPDVEYLWGCIERYRIGAFGTSPPFLARCMAAGSIPSEQFDLSSLRTIGSTGSPLPPETYHWVYENVSPSVFLRSTSGGTDVCTSILGCAPILPTRAGELQCLPLGVAATIYDEEGAPVTGVAGELVVIEPMPTMPVGLWGDRDKARLKETYFSFFPGIWRHGDWVTIYADGASVVHGRSDATLNRGGIRIGTAELYEIVETVPWIRDSVVVDVLMPGQSTSTMLLLVSVTAGSVFQEESVALLRKQIVAELSPRHVPDRIVEVGALPHTINGKRLEVPIKNVLLGRSVLEVVLPGAVSNIEALFEIERRRTEILGVADATMDSGVGGHTEHGAPKGTGDRSI